MMDVCVGFVCKEDLTKSNKYTTLAKINVEFWSKKFPVYVLTNNLSEFKGLDCKLIFDDTYYSTFNRFYLIDKLQRKYKKIIYLDCDVLFNDTHVNLDDLPVGIHAWGNWVDSWGNLKKLPYFKVWRENIEVRDDVIFPWESIFLLNMDSSWSETYREIIKLRPISRETEKLSAADENQTDQNPHHGIERCEAIAIYVACNKTGFPIHLNSDYVKPLYNSIKQCILTDH